MADEADIAQRAIEMANEVAVSRIKKVNTDPHEGPCVQCGEEVEPKRAAMGYSICFSCASYNEKKVAAARRMGVPA